MTETKKKRGPFRSNIRVGGDTLSSDDMANLARTSPEGFAARTQDLIDKGELGWDKVRDVQRLYWTLADVEVPATVDVMGHERAIMASAFPLLAGNMTIAGINAGYETVPTIGQDLVTEMDSNKPVSIHAAILAEDTNVDRVDEGQDFPLIGAGEEKFEIRHKRNGRRLAITAEMIEENNVSDIVARVNALGRIAANTIETQTLRRVGDIDGSGSSPAEPFVLRPDGAGAALYQTDNDPHTRLSSSGNRINNNALVDTTDLDAARERLNGFKDELGERLLIPMSTAVMLVPDALFGTAAKILGSGLEPGVENEINNWGPQGRWRPILMSSPKLDDLSTTVWYLGDFKRQFVRKWKLRFETMTLTDGTESMLKSRIAYQARIAWDCEIGATDYVWVVQNLSATTAP